MELQLKYKTKFKINSQIIQRKINKYKRIDKRKIINEKKKQKKSKIAEFGTAY